MRPSLRLLAILAALAPLASCLEPATITCAEVLCPATDVCVEDVGCVPAQAAAPCADADELDACTLGGLPGLCRSNVCVPVGCGNGAVDPGEVCDDGNVVDGDDCRRDCRSDLSCGNGTIDGDEACDCGRDETTRPATCAGINADDPAAACDPTCTRRCGDGVITGVEDCDPALPLADACADFGFYGGDLACNQVCRYDLSGCAGECGDGVVQADQGEVCDGAVPTGASCLDVGADWGAPQCGNNCVIDAIGSCDDYGWDPVLDAPADELWRAADGAVLRREFMTVRAHVDGVLTTLPGTFTRLRGRATTALLRGQDGLATWSAADGLVAVDLPEGVAAAAITDAALDDDGTLAMLVDCTLWSRSGDGAWASTAITSAAEGFPSIGGCSSVAARDGQIYVAGFRTEFSCGPDPNDPEIFICSLPGGWVAAFDGAAWSGMDVSASFDGGAVSIADHPGAALLVLANGGQPDCEARVVHLDVTPWRIEDVGGCLEEAVALGDATYYATAPYLFSPPGVGRVLAGQPRNISRPLRNDHMTTWDGRLALYGARVYRARRFAELPSAHAYLDAGGTWMARPAITPGGSVLFVAYGGFGQVVRSTSAGGDVYSAGGESMNALAAAAPSDLLLALGFAATVTHVVDGTPTVGLDQAGDPLTGATTLGLARDGAYLAAGIQADAPYLAVGDGDAWMRSPGPAPAATCQASALIGRDATDVDLLLTACVAAADEGVWHWDGAAWTQALAGRGVGLSLGADGTGFVAIAEHVWRRTGDAWDDLGPAWPGITDLAAVSATEAYAIGPALVDDLSPALLRFDGASWAPMRRNAERTNTNFVSGDDWVVADARGVTVFGMLAGGGELGTPYIDEWLRDSAWDGVAP